LALSRRSSRSRFTLILLVLTSVTVITLDFRGDSAGVIEGVREVALDVFSPVKDAADQVFAPVENAWNGIFNYDDLEDENERLKERLAEVQGERAQAKELQRQYRELAEQQRLPFAKEIPQVSARVITAPVSNFELSFEVSVGREQGVKEGMPVVAGRGLVGRVVRASSRQSVVQLVTDRDFAVGIRLAGSGDIGIAYGRGRDQTMTVDAIEPKTKVKTGELATTSGLVESAFPPAIPVGTVQKARAERGELQQEVTVTPLVDVAKLTFVRVLVWEPAT
jgi:rod shape-determining protein MreC